MQKLLHKVSFWIGWIFTIAVCMVLGSVAMIIHFGNDLPDYRQLEEYDPPSISRLYAIDGRLVEEYAKEKRIFTAYKDIPPVLIYAFLAAEDKNFFHHKGIDLYSIGRAMIQNFLQLGQNRAPVGGSTITQQVVKNFLLTNEQTISRKIKEAILAYRISKVYSKERILELYLNEIFLGNSSYGITAAALNYFNKELKDITIEEAAMLAALPKAPSQLNPFRHYARAKTRRDWVIERMEEESFITKQQAIKSIAAPISLQTRREEFVHDADYYAEAVRTELLKSIAEEDVYNKGYSVFTYLQPAMQEAAMAALRKGVGAYDKKRGYRGPLHNLGNIVSDEDWQGKLHDYKVPQEADGYPIAVVLNVNAKEASIGLFSGDKGTISTEQASWALKSKNKSTLAAILKKGDVIVVQNTDTEGSYKLDQVPAVNGGLVAMEVGSGKVLAMAGGYSFNSKFNRVTQAMRQPGSLFKPVAYLTALEAGYRPNDIIMDAPITVTQGAGMAAWRPKNYGGDFLGALTLRSALEKSRNTPTVRLALTLGPESIAATAVRLGLYPEAPSTLAMVLGAYETTLLNATNAYNILASYGKLTKPQLIDRIYDHKGNVVYKSNSESCIGCDIDADSDNSTVPIVEGQRTRVVDERRSYQMISLLEGVIKRGTATAALKLNRSVAGKTGTTNNSFDTWFIGFTPDIVVGVYVGFDTPKELGKRETGASLALPIFVDFMQEALKGVPDKPFRVPAGVKLLRVEAASGVVIGAEGSAGKTLTEAFLDGEDIRVANNISGDGHEITSELKALDEELHLNEDVEAKDLGAEIPWKYGESGADDAS